MSWTAIAVRIRSSSGTINIPQSLALYAYNRLPQNFALPYLPTKIQLITLI